MVELQSAPTVPVDLEDRIVDAIRLYVEDAVKEEIEKARQRIGDRISEIATKVAARVAARIRMSPDGSDILIRVQI